MSVEHLDLSDFLAIAAAVTGLDIDTIIKITDLNLADSALHAPAAGFGDTDFSPDFVDKAAVLVVRLARNHPLPRASGTRSTRPPGSASTSCRPGDRQFAIDCRASTTGTTSGTVGARSRPTSVASNTEPAAGPDWDPLDGRRASPFRRSTIPPGHLQSALYCPRRQGRQRNCV